MFLKVKNAVKLEVSNAKWRINDEMLYFFNRIFPDPAPSLETVPSLMHGAAEGQCHFYEYCACVLIAVPNLCSSHCEGEPPNWH